jgi:radical SAM-linked protein
LLSQVKQNVRIRFSKQGDIRFISHHDLMRLFERALRRAELPFATSEGHNPRPRLSFPMALSVGHTGLNEVADIGLREWTRPDEVRERLQAELPEGIGIISAQPVAINPGREPRELAYRVPLLASHTLTAQKVQALLDRTEARVTRVRKRSVREVEVRQFIKALRLTDDSLEMLIRYTSEGTAKPEEILEALGCRPDVDYRKSAIERTNVSLPPLR